MIYTLTFPTAPSMGSHAQTAPEPVILNVTGELDATSVVEVRPDVDRLVQSKPHAVRVDLTGLRSIDNSGIGLLVYLANRVRSQGGKLEVVGAKEQPRALLELVNLDPTTLERVSPSPAVVMQSGR